MSLSNFESMSIFSPSMTTPYRDNFANHSSGVASPPTERKKLELLPRSIPMSPLTPSHRRRKTLSSKSGADLFSCTTTTPTREEILASRGLDPMQVDAQYELKTNICFTVDQQRQIDCIRDQVRALEGAFREANEKELPEEDLRQQTDAKRQELHELMTRFRTENSPSGLLHSRRWSGGQHADFMPAPAF